MRATGHLNAEMPSALAAFRYPGDYGLFGAGKSGTGVFDAPIDAAALFRRDHVSQRHKNALLRDADATAGSVARNQDV
jgi:hypothetical protein